MPAERSAIVGFGVTIEVTTRRSCTIRNLSLEKMDSAKTNVCPGSAGDMIVFQRDAYKHYAVHVGNGEIVHLTTDGGNCSLDTVCGTAGHISSTTPQLGVIKKEKYSDFFKKGDKVSVEPDDEKKPLPTKEIVKRAKSRIHDRGYNLFTNNCEHFARWCRYGKEESKQADALMVSLIIVAVAIGLFFVLPRIR